MFNDFWQCLRQWRGSRRHPDGLEIKLADSGQTFFAQQDETILQAALRHGIAWPHHCRVGGCGRCKCQVQQGKVRQLTESAYVLSVDELDQHYVLACQSMAKSPLLLRLPADARAHADVPAPQPASR